MKDPNKLTKRILTFIFLVFSLFLFGAFFFLRHPQYFINDLKGLIETKISEKYSGQLDIGRFEGGFIEGFTLSNITYSINDSMIFSSEEIYINPDLSRLAMGNVILSELVINNAILNFTTLAANNTQKLNGISPHYLYYEISSLNIDNSVLIYGAQSYSINGSAMLTYGDKIECQYENFIIDSPKFESALVFLSGSSSYRNKIISMDNVDIHSTWLNGKLDFDININDYSRSSGNLRLDKIYLNIDDNRDLMINNITLSIEDSLKLSANDIFYKNLKLNNLSITGLVKDQKILTNYSFSTFNNDFNGYGKIDLHTFGWRVNTYFNNLNIYEDLPVSGRVQLESPSLFDSIQMAIELDNTKMDSIVLKLALRDMIIDSDNLIRGNIFISGEGIDGDIIFKSSMNFDDYNIDGHLNFTNFSAIDIMPFDIINNISGRSTFKYNLVEKMANFNGAYNLSNGYFLNQKFHDSKGEFHFASNNIENNGEFTGSIIEWGENSYKWNKIDYSIKMENSKISKCNLFASGALGDSIAISAEKNEPDQIYISKFEGNLKHSIFFMEPFYINISESRYQFPELNIMLDHGNLTLKGFYKDLSSFNVYGNINRIKLSKLYSLLEKRFPITGEILNGFYNIGIGADNNLFFKIENAELENGFLDNIPYNKIKINSKYFNNILNIDTLEFESDIGNLDINGNFNLNISSGNPLFTPQSKIDLEINFKDFEIQKINQYAHWKLENKGLLTGQWKMAGFANNLKITGDISIKKPLIDKIQCKSLSGRVDYQNHQLYFSKLHLTTENGEYSGFGNIPLAFNILNIDGFNIETLPIDLVITGKTKSLEFIPPYVESIDAIEGMNQSDSSYVIMIEMTGNLSNPIHNGEIIINEGKVAIDAINNAIENINGIISLNDNRLIIDDLTANMLGNISKKTSQIPLIRKIKHIFKKNDAIKKEDNLKIIGSINIENILKPDYSLHIMGDDIYLSSSLNKYRGNGSADIYITGQDTISISGTFTPDPHSFLITNIEKNEFDYTDFSKKNKYHIYDIHIPFEDGIVLDTENSHIFIDGDVTMSKTGHDNFTYSGKINIIDGRYYDNQGNVFENITGNLFLSPDPNSSYMDLHSNIDINSSRINVAIIGDPNSPQVYLADADGQFSQTELLTMLTLGSSEIDLQNNIAQVENLFSNYLQTTFERNIAKATSLDQFQLSTGNPLLSTLNGNDDENMKLIVGKRISKTIYFNTKIDFYDFNDNQYEAEYRLSKNTSLVGGINTNAGNNSFHIKYRIKYYY